MSISSDIQKLEPGAIIELFDMELDGAVVHFHAGTNELFEPVVWDGITYSPLPIQADGFEKNTGGGLPRPKIRIANIDGIISQALLTRDFEDLTGAKVTRRRTMKKYLDAVNFAEGNPSADPTAEMQPDIFFIDRKSAENKAIVEFELASALDIGAVKLPKRQIIQNSCTWRYRGAECSYAGGPVATILDAPTGDLAADQCGKRLSSCKLRFGETGVLPYGGFPAAGLARS
jgi:lambda family phage minor tail protein L